MGGQFCLCGPRRHRFKSSAGLHGVSPWLLTWPGDTTMVAEPTPPKRSDTNCRRNKTIHSWIKQTRYALCPIKTSSSSDCGRGRAEGNFCFHHVTNTMAMLSSFYSRSGAYATGQGWRPTSFPAFLHARPVCVSPCVCTCVSWACASTLTMGKMLTLVTFTNVRKTLSPTGTTPWAWWYVSCRARTSFSSKASNLAEKEKTHGPLSENYLFSN